MNSYAFDDFQRMYDNMMPTEDDLPDGWTECLNCGYQYCYEDDDIIDLDNCPKCKHPC